MKVRLTHDFKMPKQCACCLAPASTALKARHTRKGGSAGFNRRRVYELTVRIPYCEPCAKHVRGTALWLVALKTIGIWIVVGVLTMPMPAVNTWLPQVAATGCLAFEIFRRFRSPGGQHARTGPAARVAGLWSDEIHLDVANPKFASLLKETQWEPAKPQPVPVPARA